MLQGPVLLYGQYGIDFPRRIVLLLEVSDPYGHQFANRARVEIDAKYVEWLLMLMREADRISNGISGGDSLYSLEFFDNTPDWREVDEASEINMETLDEKVLEHISWSTATLHVTDGHAYWQAYVKHSDPTVQMETEIVTKGILTEILSLWREAEALYQ